MNDAASSEWPITTAAKKKCRDLTEQLADIDEAARTGKKVCRKRVKEVAGGDLVDQLKNLRARLVAVEDGAKCSRHDLYEVQKALRGEEIKDEASRLGGRGRVVGIDRELEDGTKVKIGDDENSTSIVLDNGFVMPEEYFQECHVVVEHLDVMIRMLDKRQRVKESVCSEYTPEEIAEFNGDMKKACASLAGLKDKYSAKLAEAQRLRELVEGTYNELLDEEEKARRQTKTLDRLIAQTAAAGGNEEAAREVREWRRRTRRAAKKLGGVGGAAAAAAEVDPAAVRRLDDHAVNNAATMSSANEIVDVLRDYATKGVKPSPRAAAALNDAITKKVASTASARNVADLLEAFADAGVAPSPGAREALADAVTR